MKQTKVFSWEVRNQVTYRRVCSL